MKKQSKEQSEDREREWWRPVEFKYPHSTFEGLLTMAMAPELSWLTALADLKGEASQLTELEKKFNVKKVDAVHLMSAQSAQVDYFLTWDMRLLKRARKVPWLVFRAETPDGFVSRFQRCE